MESPSEALIMPSSLKSVPLELDVPALALGRAPPPGAAAPGGGARPSARAGTSSSSGTDFREEGMINASEGDSIPTRIGQIAVPVGDLDRAVAFYEGTLGLRLLFRAPPGLA